MVTLEYQLPTFQADLWMAARLALRGGLVLTAGWTALAVLGGYQAAQAGAYAFVCAFVSLWFPRLGLALLCLLLAVGVSMAVGIGQGTLVAAFLALVCVLYCRKRDIPLVKPDGSYGNRVVGHLVDGSHVVALAVLVPILVASGFGTLPVLLLAAMAADRLVWAAPTFVASAVVLLPKVIEGRTITAAGAGLLLPDSGPERLQAVHARLDIVDMTQGLAHARWELLPSGLEAAASAAGTLVGRHPVVLVEALGWTMAALVAIWLRGVAMRWRAGSTVGPRRIVSVRAIALVAAAALVAVTELIVAPAVSGAPARRGFTAVVAQDLWHSALVVAALLALELAVLGARRWLPVGGA